MTKYIEIKWIDEASNDCTTIMPVQGHGVELGRVNDTYVVTCDDGPMLPTQLTKEQYDYARDQLIGSDASDQPGLPVLCSHRLCPELAIGSKDGWATCKHHASTITALPMTSGDSGEAASGE